MDTQGPSAAFVIAATEGKRERAEDLRARHPEIERDPWALLVLGRGWDGDANAPGGPRDWAPLLYVCHSCFASPGLARELLAAGANPNASFENEYGTMSALYGAAGVLHHAQLTAVLLEAGADPDDGESLYHATEAEDPACLALLLANGAEPRGTNALAHALDHDRIGPVKMLLEAGADPTEGALVAHAVRRGRGPEFVCLLAGHGADVNRPGGETWRGDVPLRTPYQHAHLRGRDDVAAALADLGADTSRIAADDPVSALARGQRPKSDVPDQLDPDGQEVVILSALRGHLDVVVDAVGPDFKGVVGGSPNGSLLQHAAWVGDPAVVRRLLELGASPDGALGWAAHGSAHHELPGRDYVAVAELLVGAGEQPDASMLDDASGPLYGWLEERLAGR